MSELEPTNQSYVDYINRLFAPEDSTLAGMRQDMAQEKG